MIFWRGNGVLVIVIIFLTSLCANGIALGLGGKGYWESHSWPFASAMIVAGVLIWLVDALLSRRPARTLIDGTTGEKVSIGGARDFFFIPMRWWAPITTAFGLVVLAKGWVPG